MRRVCRVLVHYFIYTTSIYKLRMSVGQFVRFRIPQLFYYYYYLKLLFYITITFFLRQIPTLNKLFTFNTQNVLKTFLRWFFKLSVSVQYASPFYRRCHLFESATISNSYTLRLCSPSDTTHLRRILKYVYFFNFPVNLFTSEEGEGISVNWFFYGSSSNFFPPPIIQPKTITFYTSTL